QSRGDFDVLDRGHSHRSGLKPAAPQQFLQGADRLRSGIELGESGAACGVGINNCRWPDGRARLLKLVVHAGVVASESSSPDNGDVDRISAQVRENPKVSFLGARTYNQGSGSLKPRAANKVLGCDLGDCIRVHDVCSLREAAVKWYFLALILRQR